MADHYGGNTSRRHHGGHKHHHYPSKEIYNPSFRDTLIGSSYSSLVLMQRIILCLFPFSIRILADKVKPEHTDDECSASQFIWPPTGRDILTRLFPSIDEFTNAWEAHPLLSKISRSKNNLEHENLIPAIFHDNDASASNLTNLLTVQDVSMILSQTTNNQPLIHGKDYKLVKKIILPPSHEMAGEEYMGMLPRQYYSIQDVLHNFHYKGFSLVIDKVQKRWRAIGEKARELEEALGVQHINVNLYLTPEALEDDDGNGGITAVKQVRQGLCVDNIFSHGAFLRAEK